MKEQYADLIAALAAYGLTKGKTPDFDKIASITGHDRSSLRSMLAPGKQVPRWLKLVIEIHKISQADEALFE